MTAHDPKKPIPRSPAKERAPQIAFPKAGPSADDPFEDQLLDQLLLEQLEQASEAQLLIVDRLLNRSRIRREV